LIFRATNRKKRKLMRPVLTGVLRHARQEPGLEGENGYRKYRGIEIPLSLPQSTQPELDGSESHFSF